MTANPRNPALSDIGDGAMPEGMEGLLKQLVWEDVDEICTRCVAPVFGGKMIVVEISPGSGEYSAGIDLGGLCFRLIQDAYDDNGFRYSAPKNFGSIDAAKAAAQADYTARVLSAVDPDEITRLRAARAELEAAVAAERERMGPIADILPDAVIAAEKAMLKFPQPNYVISKWAEETGEVTKDLIHVAEGRQTFEKLRGEIVQSLAMLHRLLVEGDQVHGLPPIALALQENANG